MRGGSAEVSKGLESISMTLPPNAVVGWGHHAASRTTDLGSSRQALSARAYFNLDEPRSVVVSERGILERVCS